MPGTPDASIDQDTLLTTAELCLSHDIRVLPIRQNRVVVKYVPAARYLVLDPEQWLLLQHFHRPASASRVLCDVINERRCPPLRDYYELVLQALRAGVLQTPGLPPPSPRPAAAWRYALRPGFGRFFAFTCMVLSTVLILLNPPSLPTEWWQLALGWLVLCLAPSLGELLSGCLLRGGEADVYSPRLLLKSPLPRFTLSLRDRIMLGREGEIDVALVRLAPYLLFSALATLFAPFLVLPLLGGLLHGLSPFQSRPMFDLLCALYRDPPLSIARDPRFAVRTESFFVLLRRRLQLAEHRFLAARAIYSLVWLGLVLFAASTFLHFSILDMLAHFRAAGGVRITAWILFGALGAGLLGVLGLGAWMAWNQTRAALEPWLRRRAARRPAAPLTPETIRACLGRNALFRTLGEAERGLIADAMTPRELAKGAVIVRQGEPGRSLFVLYSGTAEVLREQEGKRPELVAELMPDDAFGEVALLRDGVRTRTVRAGSRVVLLELDRPQFESLVLAKLSGEQIETSLQKIAFLARAPLSRRWTPSAMAAFARRARFLPFEPGQVIVPEGRTNQFFHFLHEGELEVRKDGKRVATLVSGDFFGEISLLQNSVASASIVAFTPGRCLVVARKEFLDFVSGDFVVGLHFEEIGSQRLGQPLFPRDRATFAEAR